MYAYKTATLAYKAVCFIALIAMITYWAYKYVKDEDLCLVDYKSFKEKKNEEHPSLLSNILQLLLTYLQYLTFSAKKVG